ncbi:cysteine ABC transporter substrate-binding protein [Schaalia odontolytica]|uniref:cysteine ABC transporter substrate-binding protein n=1 Tax=Schaalia odontolytica TaxID=1660 RepID=UPI00211C3447|nr:cysteine ABC transporter substrate-binding protein [Schaalia odontolytica]UUO93285.1 cysteine ABC transporter substrate-binding protein [Schaalia odontolytica]
MSATHARKKPFLRLATAALATVAALGMAACSGGAGSDSATGAQVGDRSPEQIKEAGEIVIGIFSDKAPFGYIDADGKPAGYDVVYGDRIAADLGVTAKYVPVDAAARTEVLASNKVDITLANFTVTPERAEKVDFANPYFKVSLGVVSPSSAEITDVGQLAGKTLIVTKGTTAEAYFEANHPEVKLQKYDQYSDAYQALEDGRGDAFSTDNTEVIAWAIAHPGFSVGIKSLGETSYIAAAVKKGNAPLLDWLNNQLTELGEENFFHKDYEETLAPVYGDAATPDDLVVEGGVDTASSTN